MWNHFRIRYRCYNTSSLTFLHVSLKTETIHLHSHSVVITTRKFSWITISSNVWIGSLQPGYQIQSTCWFTLGLMYSPYPDFPCIQILLFIIYLPVVGGSVWGHIAFNSDLFTSLVYLVYSRTVPQLSFGLLWQHHCCRVLLWHKVSVFGYVCLLMIRWK